MISNDQDNSRNNNIPNEFLCPVTHEIMKDPVIAEDTYTYERSTIEEIFASDPIISPMTGETLASGKLTSNRSLKEAIERYNATSPATNIDSIMSLSQLELTEDLSKFFKESQQELINKSIFQQTIVALAGLYINQAGDTSFTKEAGKAHVILSLKLPTSNDINQFKMYYNSTCSGVLVNHWQSKGGLTEIAMNAKLLYRSVIPALVDLKENSHKNLIQNNATTLNVPYNDVFHGVVVEGKIARKASIMTSQHNAEYRRNEDYSTRFMLNFANEQEHNKFVAYYSGNYPSSIISHSDYEVGKKSQINFSTRLLTKYIIPDLKDVSVNNQTTNRAQPVRNQESFGYCITM